MSSLAHAFWPRWYRTLALFDPIIERFWRRFGIGNVVRVVIVGRRSGLPRPLFLGVLRVQGREYLGHPDVACHWTRNVEAAGRGELEEHDGRRRRFSVALLEHGSERDAVVRATFTQHPFPGGVVYWLLRHHVWAVGRFYRLSYDIAGAQLAGANTAPTEVESEPPVPTMALSCRTIRTCVSAERQERGTRRSRPRSWAAARSWIG